MVYEYGEKYKHLLDVNIIDICLSGCWVHDTIEDARQTYNDVKKVLGEEVAEIAYALTNEKGRNRKERANDKYYNGIIETKGARFVKICDRLANIKYSTTKNSNIKSVYLKEFNDFKLKLYHDDYDEMFKEMEELLK